MKNNHVIRKISFGLGKIQLRFTVFFFWFSSFVNCISLFLKTISYLRQFDI
jgi:hypothetical protein